jgi:hypothetical protein
MEQKFLRLTKARGIPSTNTWSDWNALYEAHGLCAMLRAGIGSFYEAPNAVRAAHPDWTDFQIMYFSDSSIEAFCPDQMPPDLQGQQPS